MQPPSAFLTGVGAAAGIGLINSFGNLSGFLGPYLTGCGIVAGFMVLSGVIVLLVGRKETP